MKKYLSIILLSLVLIAKAEGQTKPPSHEIYDRLLKKNVTADGKVNYKAFIKDSVELNKYLAILSSTPPDEKTWSKIEHGRLRKKFDDPRVHIALVCASKSCPILLNEAYDPKRMDEQMAKQARAFLADPFRNKISADKP
jgi:Protein of unknown function, DUF547